MGLEQRKTEQEVFTKEERLQQIQRMRDRLNNHTANQNRDANTKTIHNNTKHMMQQRAAEMKTQSQEKSKEAPSR